MTRVAGMVSALATLLMVLAPAQAAADTEHVTIAQYAYGSASVTVRVGDSVTWMNHDQAQHDVVTTSAPTAFQSPMLATNQSWTFQFTQPGTYSYYCSVHPDMRAEVVVLPAETPVQEAPPPVQQEQPAEPPAAEQGDPAANTTPPPSTAAPPPTAAPPTSTSSPVTAAVQPSAASKSLDPMLLVAGLTVAVAVLCLLLISARPERE